MCSLESKASINKTGAVLIGKYLSCDGFDTQRFIGAITHFHGDHIQAFETSLHTYENIFVTFPTKDLLIAVKGDWLKYRSNLTAKPYLKTFDYKDEKITFYPASHVLGSAQIEVESEGTRILNTGDFRWSTPPIETDVLVMEATYGSPSRVRSYSRDKALRTLVARTKKELKRGPVCILASRGKLEESMNILYKADVEVPFLLHLSVVRRAQVYKAYHIEVGDFLQIGTKDAEEIIRKKQPHISFYPMRSRVHAEHIYTRISVSGYATTPEFYKVTKKEYVVGLSDHCDFKELLEYVKQSRPKLVITDAYRCADAKLFAKEIRKNLNIKAKPMP